ncbi:hypothetical protein [Bartonella machadoae]|uniref:hypothetical protein n=1 Tax=Bartonella machadoae TaxID=2893471 RepID=UPI001F4CE26F|nr:hypothetical protein [Bartonella machadoae]UNE53913.1 hypothetical protein LNM86_10055 [Bartonella machadoae]
MRKLWGSHKTRYSFSPLRILPFVPSPLCLLGRMPCPLGSSGSFTGKLKACLCSQAMGDEGVIVESSAIAVLNFWALNIWRKMRKLWGSHKTRYSFSPLRILPFVPSPLCLLGGMPFPLRSSGSFTGKLKVCLCSQAMEDEGVIVESSAIAILNILGFEHLEENEKIVGLS